MKIGNQIVMWSMDWNHIGHIVLFTRDRFVGTACQDFATYGKPQKKEPKRKCRACMKRLKHLKPVAKEAVPA